MTRYAAPVTPPGPASPTPPPRPSSSSGSGPVPLIDGTPSFKRTFVLPGLVFTAAEIALVVWPAFQLFLFTEAQRDVMVRAALPVFIAASVLWFAALGSWLAPVQKVVGARRKNVPA